ncbi:MAG: rhomboid family intramembrane serine protease [Bacteroidota bacterium]
MQNNRSFIDELKFQYQSGGMHIKLIFVNAVFFLLIALFNVISALAGTEEFKLLSQEIFTLDTSFSEFIHHPWGLFTSIFSHFKILHFLFNMLMLYFAGSIFQQFFSSRRLLSIYILGGLAGGIFEILAYSLAPGLADQPSVVVGASGSIMAIFMCMAFYKPNIQVSLFGVLPVPIIYLGLFFLLIDFISLGMNDGTAHFAHLGGAIIGMAASQRPHSQNNIVYGFERLLSSIGNFFRSFRNRSTVRVAYKNKQDPRKMTDEDFNLDKKKRQELVDRILDKISKSGYESLSKAEKEFLFKQTNKNG